MQTIWSLRDRIRWAFFPGMNLHARLRYCLLPEEFEVCPTGAIKTVLDAGCGNGMLSYQSYLRGNRVTGVSIKQEEVAKCRRLFNGLLRIPEDRLRFEHINLYEIERLGAVFDEIICSEVLEHIVRDRDIICDFYSLLKPGGILHLCCPNADHPDNAATPLDVREQGGHVRSGYTLDGYKQLLEPVGFRIERSFGLGGPVRQFFNSRITRIQHYGKLAAVLLFPAGILLSALDCRNPAIPYSIYVKARKPRAGQRDNMVVIE